MFTELVFPYVLSHKNNENSVLVFSMQWGRAGSRECKVSENGVEKKCRA